MLVPVKINNQTGKAEIKIESFDVDELKAWVCEKLKLEVKDYKMIFHLVPSFKIDLVHEPQQKEEVKPSEKEEATRKKVKKISISQRRKSLENKRNSAKALVERKAQEIIEREKKRNIEMIQRAKEAEETKRKHHKPKSQNEPTMLELITAKVENIQKGERLNANTKLGFTTNNKLNQKLKKLHELLLGANLVSVNKSEKIFTLEATAEECINFIKELGES